MQHSALSKIEVISNKNIFVHYSTFIEYLHFYKNIPIKITKLKR